MDLLFLVARVLALCLLEFYISNCERVAHAQGKMRKKPKDEPIDVEDYEEGGGPLLTDDTGRSDSLI